MKKSKNSNIAKEIIIAEDDPDILEILTIIAEKAGYTVETTVDGQSLMGNRVSWPNLIIMDRRLRGLDGLEICQHLKKSSKTKNIPIVIISATPDLASCAKNAGASDFLEKPFNVKDIQNMINKYIH